MPILTPADVRDAAFNKPPLGRRGYDEEEVDAFLDQVERSITELTREISTLREQLDAGAGSSHGSVLSELELIKRQLARIEQAMFSHRQPY